MRTVTADVDGSPAQPAGVELEQVDMHRLLRDPDGLSEMLSELDCAEAAQAVGYLAANLHRATEIDAIGIIDQMALLCEDYDERLGQSSTNRLNHPVAALVAACMQFVAADDVEIVIVDFVSTASLAVGCELLLKIGHGQRPARAGRRVDAGSDVRYVTDASAVEPAMEIWRHRATRAMVSGYVVEQGDLFVVLDGLSRFGVGATGADAVAASSGEKEPAWTGLRTG